MKSFKRLGIDPLVVYGTLCVKCPMAEPDLAPQECVARLIEEIAIVQPKIVVVMGEPSLRILNGLQVPLSRPIEQREGEIQAFTPTIDALYVPDIDESPRRRGRQAALLARLPHARQVVRGPAAVLARSGGRGAANGSMPAPSMATLVHARPPWSSARRSAGRAASSPVADRDPDSRLGGRLRRRLGPDSSGPSTDRRWQGGDANSPAGRGGRRRSREAERREDRGRGSGGNRKLTRAARKRAEAKPSELDDETPTASWPFFGRLPQRTHYLGGPIEDLDPPFKVLWHINTHALIEFPPAIFGGVAYLVNKYGNVYAVRLKDKKILWTADRPQTAARGADRRHRAGLLRRSRLRRRDRRGADRARTRRPARSTGSSDLDAHLESSPLIVGKTLYIGTDSKQVLAIDTADGHKIWEYKANAAIKASPSFHEGLIYVGNYQSGMLALHAKTGKLAWRTNTTQRGAGRQGRLLLLAGDRLRPRLRRPRRRRRLRLRPQDRQDRLVLPDRRRRLRLARGGARCRAPRRPSTSAPKTARLFALHASNGKERWHADVGGPIPGTASVIGNTVFSSSFKTRQSVGYDVHTHKRDFTLHSAGYSPVVSDGHRLYVAGYYTFYGLEEVPGTK